MAQHSDPAKQRRWLALVHRWCRSRLSVRDFCERHGLSEANFYAWRRVLRRRGLLGDDTSPAEAATAPPAFVKVAVDSAATSSSAIDLVLPQGRLLRLRPGFDPNLLRQLLDLLEERSC